MSHKRFKTQVSNRQLVVVTMPTCKRLTRNLSETKESLKEPTEAHSSTLAIRRLNSYLRVRAASLSVKSSQDNPKHPLKEARDISPSNLKLRERISFTFLTNQCQLKYSHVLSNTELKSWKLPMAESNVL